MKLLYSRLIAGVILLVFASPALADPGKTWDKQINKPGRFKVLKQFGNAAVLDQETGRVWEQSPSTGTFTWADALAHCYRLEVGGRKGWRPPTIEELASLVDTANASPALPTGHPFTLTSGQEDGVYWSATTLADVPADAWRVVLNGGDVGGVVKTLALFVWCVRGGQGIDGVQ